MSRKGSYVRLNSLNLSNYEINQAGDVRNFSTKRSLSQHVNKAGVRYVGVMNDDRTQVTYAVGKLVLLGHIGESSDPRKKYTIHKDGDRNNVRLSNLKWATKSEVIYYMKMYAHALEKPQYINVQIKEMNTGRVFMNSLEAAAVTGIAPTDIYHSAIGYDEPRVPSHIFKFAAVN